MHILFLYTHFLLKMYAHLCGTVWVRSIFQVLQILQWYLVLLLLLPLLLLFCHHCYDEDGMMLLMMMVIVHCSPVWGPGNVYKELSQLGGGLGGCPSLGGWVKSLGPSPLLELYSGWVGV